MSSYQGSNSCQQLLAQVTPLFEGKEVADSLPSFLLPACRAADTDVVGACTGYHQWVCVWRGGGSLLQSQRLKDTPAPWSQQLPDGDKYDQWHHWLQQSLIFISGGLVLRWRLGEQSMSQCSGGELMIRFFFLWKWLVEMTHVFVLALPLLLMFFTCHVAPAISMLIQWFT